MKVLCQLSHLKMLKKEGVYEVEAIVFGSRFYQYEDSYTRYINCWTGMYGYHYHGEL